MAKRPMTPIEITSARYFTAGGRSRQEIDRAISRDGIWSYERSDEPGTPWIVMHRETGRWHMFGNLPAARRATADGSLAAYLEIPTAAPATV